MLKLVKLVEIDGEEKDLKLEVKDESSRSPHGGGEGKTLEEEALFLLGDNQLKV